MFTRLVARRIIIIHFKHSSKNQQNKNRYSEQSNEYVLKKGTEVTTYGAPYTFKNDKKYYKINNDKIKTYVKA
ncbi:MAG: SLAP domain-containing protein [Lactobacillus sp.]|nr:SLAP domain-containing protein [Lactobacillus sp.]